MRFMTAHFTERDRVFLFVTAKNWDKLDLFRAVQVLVGGALAYYGKRDCLAIIDRDGEHFDLGLSRPDYNPTAEDVEAGRKHFGHLRTNTVDISRL
jgi:hypothetical protein